MSDKDNYIFMIVDGKPFTLADLGPAADMRLDLGMQSILDQGLLGDQYKGIPWYKVFPPGSFDTEAIPDESSELCFELHRQYMDRLKHYSDLSGNQSLTTEQRSEVALLRDRWKMAEKLSRP